MDDFLATAPITDLLTELYDDLALKYTIKRLGSPTRYLNWNILQLSDGSVHLSQPHTIQSILHKLQMANCNPKYTPRPENPTPIPSLPPERNAGTHVP